MALVLAASYFAIAVAAHALACRLPLPLSSALKFVALGCVAGLGLLVHLLLVAGPTLGTLAGMVAYALAAELYLFLSTMVISSVSAIWLRRLHKGGVAAADVPKLYSPAWMVDIRLGRLTDNGFLIPTDGSYRLTPKARRLIAAFGRLRAFFGHARRSP